MKNQFIFTLLILFLFSINSYAAYLENVPVEVNCYPNPFSDEITIELDLAKESKVKIEVANILGQSIKTFSNEKFLPAGINRFQWNGKNETDGGIASEGIYYINVNGDVINRKIVYSKMH